MKRLKIEVITDLKLAKESLSNTQFFFYKMKHILIKEPVVTAIKLGLSRKFDVTSKGEITTIEMVGEDLVVEQEKKQLENFMFSKEATLKKSRYYRDVKSDRKVQMSLKIIKEKLKEKKQGVFKSILGGNSVLGWFNSVGLMIIWNVEDATN